MTVPRQRQGRKTNLTPNRAKAKEKSQREKDKYTQRQLDLDLDQDEVPRPARRRQRVVGPLRGAACQPFFSENDVHPLLQPHSCGEFNIVCTFCQNGKVDIESPPPPPQQ